MNSGAAYGHIGDYLLWCVLYLSLLVHGWFFFRYFPKSTRPRTRLLLGNSLVFLILLGTVAIAAESYLRFIHVEMDAFGVSIPAQRWLHRHVRLNSLGYRDREWPPPKPTGVRRIAFLGDSFTYGWGIRRVEDRFTERLQRRFDERSPGAVEVMNLAEPGWDTRAEAAALPEMIDTFAIDEVVLCYVPNDIEKLIPRDDAFDPTAPPEPVYVNVSSSALIDYLYRRLWLPRAPTVQGYHDWLADGFANPDVWRRHQQQLFELVRTCRDRGVTVRVVLFPFLRLVGVGLDRARLHRVLGDFFEKNEVPVLDLLPTLAAHDPAELTVSHQDPHPNEKAHALFADAMWDGFYKD